MGEVGKKQVRVDGYDKATGRTKYYEDLMPRDALYARIKHSEIAHGYVKVKNEIIWEIVEKDVALLKQEIGEKAGLL